MHEDRQVLSDSGERMVPEHADPRTFWEHIARYKFAIRYIPGKDVLDIACGEGYGTRSLLEGGAASVIGVDRSAESCEHARTKYGVDARPGDAEAIPLDDNQVDVVVSFETVEHLAAPDQFVRECRRVLRPGGLLIISTPEVQTYQNLVRNDYHCSEMTEAEFRLLLASNFEHVAWFSQSLMDASWWTLRSFSALHSPWRRSRGFWRLAALCHQRHDRIDEADRQSPVGAILARPGLLAELVNPYRIHRRATWTRERPTYLLAVARKPRA